MVEVLPTEDDRYTPATRDASPWSLSFLPSLNFLPRRLENKKSSSMKNFTLWYSGKGRITISVNTKNEPCGLELSQVMEKLSEESSAISNLELLGWTDSENILECLSILSMERISPMAISFNECQLPDLDLSYLSCKSFSCIQSDLTPQTACRLCNTMSMSLSQLALSYNPIGDNPIKIIALQLENGSMLEGLQLIGCHVSDVGAIALARSLAVNPRLTKLALSANNITNVGVKALCSSLSTTNTTLQDLQLGYNPFGQDGFDTIALALQRMSCRLSRLYLHGLIPSFVPFPPQQPLLHALTVTSSLRELNLAFNHLSDNGAKLVALILNSNRSIEILQCSSCYIGDEGTAAIAESLETNRTLQELWFTNNQFEDAGVQSLATMLLTNDTLRLLDLGSVMCDRPAAMFMKTVLQRPTSGIQQLHFLPSCCAAASSLVVDATTDPMYGYFRLEFQLLRSNRMKRVWRDSEFEKRLPLLVESFATRSEFCIDLIYHTLRNKPEVFDRLNKMNEMNLAST